METKKNSKKKGDDESLIGNPMSRRTFLKVAGVIGAGVASVGYLKFDPKKASAQVAPTPDALETDADVTLIRSFCLMCHSDCGSQGKIKDGVLVKLDGNPWHPNCNDYDVGGTATEEVTIANTPFDPTTTVGTLCPKGQAGIMTLYDPYRVMHPLKRDGPRGSGKWKVITWDTAITEIMNGGTVDGHTFDGLATIRGDGNSVDDGTGHFDLTDFIDWDDLWKIPNWAVIPSNPTKQEVLDATDAPNDLEDLGFPQGTLLADVTVVQIQDKVREYFGPKANQLCVFYGRNMQGDTTKRFAKYTFGSKNHHGHTSICEASLKAGGEWMFTSAEDFPDSASSKWNFKPDVVNADLMILFGSTWLEAGFPMQTLSRYMMDFKAKGGTLIMVDPRFSASAAKADTWVPIKVGTDAALALAICREIIAQNLYDDDYLSRPNLTAAQAGSHPTFTDMTVLVDDTTKLYVLDGNLDPQVYSGGAEKPFNDVSVTTADLEPTVPGKQTVFQLFKAECEKNTTAEWEIIADVPAGTVATIITAIKANPKFAIDQYKGPCQHTNGLQNVRCIHMISVLMNRVSQVGGIQSGGGSHSKNGAGFEKKFNQHGIYYDRHKQTYKRSDRPAHRQWYPFATHGVCQEIYGAVADGYPYKCKAMLIYYQGFAYTYPYNQVAQSTMKDTNAIPLLVSIDAFMGESTALADYILPDTTMFERWSLHGSHPAVKTKCNALRQPMVGDLDPTTHVFTPINPDTRMLEDILIALGKKLAVSNYGTDGMGTGKNLDTAWDFFNEYISDWGGLDTTLYSTAKDHLVMGGLFQTPKPNYVPATTTVDAVPNTYKDKSIQVYISKFAKTKNALTMKSFAVDGYDVDGWPHGYHPLPTYVATRDAADRMIKDYENGYNFQLICFKPVQHTQSRTGQNQWLMALEPENAIEINSKDAADLGVRTGDMVKISSATNMFGMKVKCKVTEHIRPGTALVGWGWGHWEMGAKPWSEDGTMMPTDPTNPRDYRSKGYNVNGLMRADPVYVEKRQAAMVTSDNIGGSSNQYDHWVKIERG